MDNGCYNVFMKNASYLEGDSGSSPSGTDADAVTCFHFFLLFRRSEARICVEFACGPSPCGGRARVLWRMGRLVIPEEIMPPPKMNEC